MEFHFTALFVYLVLHECAAFRCGLHFSHGKVRPWCERARYSLCSYLCDDGYDATDILATCSSRGTWESSAGPPCVAKPCSSHIPHGSLSDSCYSRVGSTCGYSCDTGYQKKAGVYNITCQPSTNWSVSPHSLCTNDQQCPYEITNGDLDLSCNRTYGETCGYSCHEGHHTPGGSVEITCGSQGSLIWNHWLSSLCQKTVCPSEIPHGYVSSRCSREYDDICDRFHCNNGYAQTVSGFTIWCNASGQWDWNENRGQPCATTGMQNGDESLNSIARPTCVHFNRCARPDDKSVCPSAVVKTSEICPSSIENGEILWCSRQPGSRCLYNCNSGCTQDHAIKYLNCGNNGHWDYEDHLCYDCRPTTTTPSPPSNCPSVIHNGYISSACPRYSNLVCDYYCDEDCQPYFKSQQLYCTKNGYWEHGTDACSCQGSEAGPLSEDEHSTSAGVIVGIVVSLLVFGCLLFALVWVCYKRQLKQRTHNQPQSQDSALPDTGPNGTFYRVSLPEYLPSNRTNSHSSLQHLNRTEQNSDMQPTEQSSDVQPQEPAVDSSHISAPPEYNTLIPQEPGVEPPSYEQVISHPTQFRPSEESESV